MRTTLKDLTGERYGRLLVLQRSVNIGRRVAWLCRCDCGEAKITTGNQLQRGHVVSCGCRRREVLSNLREVGRANATHGHTRGGKPTPEFRTWTSMLNRCGNPNNTDYQRYGGRGITVCERWQSFENFLADMGPRPSPRHSIDRINNDGNYEPGNCRWATQAEQTRNQRTSRIVAMDGRSQSVAAWAEEYGLKADTVRHRLDRGHSLREALKAVAD